MGAGGSALTVSAELLAKDLTGRTFIVTGGNSGIGYGTAAQLAKQKATVVIGCRRLDAGQAAVDEINAANGNSGKLTAMVLDLASLSSVRKFAAEFKKSHSALHCLINNAGIMNTPVGTTSDGFETQFGTNHLGHFLLTNLLTDSLKASAPSRVVCLTSAYHNEAQGRKGHIDFDDLNFERRKYDGWTAYAQSKLANLLHARELGRRLAPVGITAVSVHPGFVRSNLINNTMGGLMQRMADPYLVYGEGMIEPWEGIQTSLHCALAEDLIPGAYYAQNNSPKGVVGGWPAKSPLPEASDDAVATRLWEVSEALVKGKGL